MATWFVVRHGKEHGPFDGTQLQTLAAKGKLKPDDLVRREDASTGRPAKEIKGLFQLPPAIPSQELQKESKAPTLLPAPPQSASSQPFLPRSVVIVVGAIVAVFGLMTFCCCGMIVAGQGIRAGLQEDLADGDRLWAEDEKEAAVAKYRSLLDHRSTMTNDMPRIYGRLIDHAYETEDDSEGQRLVSEAMEHEIQPSVTNAEALAAIKEVRAKQEAVEAERIAQNEAKAAAEALKSAPVEEQLKALPNERFVAATAIYSDFNSNEVTADAKYDGKEVFVFGKVHSVEKSGFGGVTLKLASDRFDLPGVICSLSSVAVSSEPLNRVEAGHYVKIRGTCKGLDLAKRVQIDGCDFILIGD